LPCRVLELCTTILACGQQGGRASRFLQPAVMSPGSSVSAGIPRIARSPQSDAGRSRTRTQLWPSSEVGEEPFRNLDVGIALPDNQVAVAAALAR